MSLSESKLSKLISLASKYSIAQIAEKYGMSYTKTRMLLKDHGVTLHRGRKRGSGQGWELSVKAQKDRRIYRMSQMLRQGKCTSCGRDNDSESIYHCRACLKTRNEQAKERNRKRKTEISGDK